MGFKSDGFCFSVPLKKVTFCIVDYTRSRIATSIFNIKLILRNTLLYYTIV